MAKPLPPAQPRIGTEMSRVATQSIADNTNTAVIFDTLVRDDLGAWRNNQSTRFTIQKAGWYMMQGDIGWSSSNSYKIVGVWLSGAPYLCRQDFTGNFGPFMNVTHINYLIPGHFLELYVFRFGGVATTVTGRFSLLQLAGA